jgi:hypothetical protein
MPEPDDHPHARPRKLMVVERLSCGSGFPDATVEVESLAHKKPSSLADTVTPGVMAKHQTPKQLNTH